MIKTNQIESICIESNREVLRESNLIQHTRLSFNQDNSHWPRFLTGGPAGGRVPLFPSLLSISVFVYKRIDQGDTFYTVKSEIFIYFGAVHKRLHFKSTMRPMGFIFRSYNQTPF